MATTVWKGHLSFGMVAAPVKLFAAVRSESVGMNQLHSCMSKIKMDVRCPACEKVVDRKDLIKGYPIGDDKYVVITEADLESITPESSSIMTITGFVDETEVDPSLYNASYYVAADKGGTKAYGLIHAAMMAQGKAALASVTMHQREHLCVIRAVGPADGGGLMLHTLYYQDEVRQVAEWGTVDAVNVKEVNLAITLINAMSMTFQHGDYSDGYRAGLMVMISAKVAGEAIKAQPKTKSPETMDLMQALKASIVRQEAEEKKPTGRKKKPIEVYA